MKLKSILLTAAVTISLATATMAQNVPSYVPTNGLVGWWPFNGNANDESGNGNNGTVNGATLTSDRFGNVNNAYDFNGNSYIFSNNVNNLPLGNNSRAFCLWMKTNVTSSPPNKDMFNWGSGTTTSQRFGFTMYSGLPYFCAQNDDFYGNTPIGNNNWHFIVINYDGNLVSIFVDGILDASQSKNLNTVLNDLIFGRSPLNHSSPSYYTGTLDDIGIWNRALTQQEITDLYSAVNCANNTAITPQTNSLATSSTATFTATTSDPNPSYVWQSDLGQGYVTLNNYGNYSGVNTATLNIDNVQLSEHNQPIRVITTSGNCIDTSNVAVINILDTCITNVTVYDTLLTTVTDTLVINAQITGINPPNNLNTLKVFPNPASTHITIDYGNFNAMSGYTLTIVNSIGQTVFTTPINQQTSFIDLSTWTGNGIYFVQLIDPQNNTIENRKIVIQ